VLAWDAVTAGGQPVRATPHHTADLYWALSGGGGTYSIAVSMTVRMYRDVGPTGGAWLVINATLTAPFATSAAPSASASSSSSACTDADDDNAFSMVVVVVSAALISPAADSGAFALLAT
jgi:FAD/FMN-containing dehydrogenase